MSIREAVNIVNALLPTGNDLRKIKTITAAVSFVEFLMKEAVGYSFTQSNSNGYRGLEFIVTAPSKSVGELYEKLFEDHAMFYVKETTRKSSYSDGSEEVKFLFLEEQGHINFKMISMPDTVAYSEYWNYCNKLSYSLIEPIASMIELHGAIQRSEGEAVRWFTDRLPEGEKSGPHLLALQNFMYRHTI